VVIIHEKLLSLIRAILHAIQSGTERPGYRKYHLLTQTEAGVLLRPSVADDYEMFSRRKAGQSTDCLPLFVKTQNGASLRFNVNAGFVVLNLIQDV
jgi:hypothetical protein